MSDADLVARVVDLEARLRQLEVLAAGPAPRDERPIRAIIRYVAFQMGLTATAITGSRRAPALMRARRAVIWGARTVTGATLGEIGNSLGGRDHSTIKHAFHTAEALRERDPAFRFLTNRLLHRFSEHSEETAQCPQQ